ncbi:MAG: response regulator transcription factor [Acidimicrobiia bacterium]
MGILSAGRPGRGMRTSRSRGAGGRAGARLVVAEEPKREQGTYPGGTNVREETLRVVVVEDHEITRNGIVTLLGGAGIETVASVGTGEETVGVIEEHRPDVVLLDIRLPDELGIRTLRRIRARFPDVPVLILTSHGYPSLARAAFSSGATGFILKRIDSRRLTDSVWRVARGEQVYDEEVVGIIEDATQEIDPRLVNLSPRQREVLRHIGEGLTNREIAMHLSLSEKTVKNYVSAILERIGVPTRSAAAAYVARIQAESEIHLPSEDW